MARPRKDGTAPKTTKTTKATKAKAADVEKSIETPAVVEPVVENSVETVDETPVVVPEVPAESEAETTDKPAEGEITTEDAPAVVDTPAEEPQTGDAPAEDAPTEDAPTEEPVAETEKKDDAPKAPKKASKKNKKVAINGIVSLSGPTAIYRGPGVYPFAKINGVVKPLGDADETGYTKVQCVISGSGVCEGYVKL